MPALDTVVAVVVHHDSVETLSATLSDLTGAGLSSAQIVVVDNSESKVSSEDLVEAVGSRAAVLRTANRGYGAAANTGFDWAATNAPAASARLLVTHEVRIAPTTLEALVAELDRDPRAGAAAPVLKDASYTDALWSTGGYLTPKLKLPRHNLNRVSAPVEREWADGACVLYRTAAVADRRIDESYFLYLEEVDFQQQLRADGWRIMVVPEEASQSSGGMPGYFAARNTRLFQRRWGRSPWRALAGPYVVIRQVVRRLVRGQGDSVARVLAGWRDGRGLQ